MPPGRSRSQKRKPEHTALQPPGASRVRPTPNHGRGSRRRKRPSLPSLWPVLLAVAAILLASTVTITYLAERRHEQVRRDWAEHRRRLGLDTTWIPAPHDGHAH